METNPDAPNWVWECTNPECGEIISGWVDDPQGILVRCGPFKCPACRGEMKSGPLLAVVSQKTATSLREVAK